SFTHQPTTKRDTLSLHDALPISPRPRKERPAADRIAVAIKIVVLTIIGDMIFGKICWKIILPSRAPKALTASTYSSFLVVNVDPRTIRANCGKAPIAIAIVTLIVLPPRTDTIASAKRIPGKAS